MKFTKEEMQQLLSASYDPKLYNVGKFIIDKSISDQYVKTYTITDSNDVVVVHRGSNDKQDWIDNVAHAIDVNIKYTKTYKMHLRRQMKAVKKYGADNIVCLGHSRGALYCDEFYRDKLCKQVIVYNMPITKRSVINSLFANVPLTGKKNI